MPFDCSIILTLLLSFLPFTVPSFLVSKSLGTWVQTQRQLRKAGKLSDDQIKKLEGIGFKWILRTVSKYKSFDERLVELVAYKEEHGHCNVPNKYAPNPVCCVSYWSASE